MLYMLTRALNEFLQEQLSTEPGGPPNVKEWEALWQCRIVKTNKQDPDNIGYVPWRIAFYVSGGPGAVQNLEGCQFRKDCGF